MKSYKIEEKLKKMLGDSGALLHGHFLLTSGLHSEYYLQCALLLRYPEYASFAGKEIASMFKGSNIDIVAAPAIGGLIIGHEVAKELKVPFIFYERENGRMKLRRFPEPRGKNVLVIEDVITTGSSVKEVGDMIIAAGAQWIATSCIVDRSQGDHLLESPPISLMRVSFPVYEPSECPLCKSQVSLVKPGSRDFNK